MAETIVFINNDANAGKAKQRWTRVRPSLQTRWESIVEVAYTPPYNFLNHFENLGGKTNVISAGGDGTVHWVLQSLMRLTEERRKLIRLGAIGLGSSNDFIKPVSGQISEFPVRLSETKTDFADVGLVRFLSDQEKIEEKYFLINASLGITAEANLFFSSGKVDWLKRRSTSLAIGWSALRTMGLFQPFEVTLHWGGRSAKFERLNNLAILKTPHVSGGMVFDIPVTRNDGLLGVGICQGMSRLETLQAFNDLNRGRFQKLNDEKRQSFLADHLKVNTDKWVALEVDGEVFKAKDPEFFVIPGAVSLMGLGQ